MPVQVSGRKRDGGEPVSGSERVVLVGADPVCRSLAEALTVRGYAVESLAPRAM
jgi:hypothetical protein